MGVLDVSTVIVWNDDEIEVQHCLRNYALNVADKLRARVHTDPEDPRWQIQHDPLVVQIPPFRGTARETVLIWNETEVRVEHQAQGGGVGRAVALRTQLHKTTQDPRWQVMPKALAVKINENRPRPDLNPPGVGGA